MFKPNANKLIDFLIFYFKRKQNFFLLLVSPLFVPNLNNIFFFELKKKSQKHGNYE